jgi:hypothetical protein
MRITVELTEPQIRRLEEVARRLGISAEALAAAAVQDLMARDDSEFERIVAHVLQKNADLYRRLA